MTKQHELPTKASLLAELEELSAARGDTDDEKRKLASRRKSLWRDLAKADDKTDAEEFVAELAEEFGIPAITVQRWVRGDFVPRPLTLKRLREHFGLVPRAREKKPSNLDAPVAFGAEHSYAALRTIDHFFHALAHAKCCFVFKGMLGFHAARQETVRTRLVETLKASPDRIVYYVFRKGTEGELTFERLKKRVEQTDPEVSRQMRAVTVPEANDKLGLGMSLASPFLVRYNDEGRLKFKRAVDIWYELPVERLDANNQVNDEQSLFVFVQLPSFESEELWDEWRKWLRNLPSPDIRNEDVDD